MNVVYRFRIYPNKIQQELFAKTFGCVRFVYNRMLAEKKECYEKTGKNLKVTPAKYKAEFPWLKEVDSLALCNAQLHLQIAYKNFFRDPSFGFPRFKSKKNPVKSYTTNSVNGNILLKDGKLKLPKAGWIRIRQHRKIREDACLKGASVCMEADGRYYVSLLYFCEEKPVEIRNIRQAVGLDFSMKELYVDSNGKHAGYPHYFRNSEEKLAKAQRKLSHCRKGSNRYKKQQKKVARIHTHIAHQRKDYLHKESEKNPDAKTFGDLTGVQDFTAFMASKPDATTYDDVDEFKNGECYYTYWIQHQDNKNSHLIVPMEYSIVRNNIYELQISGVSGLGFARSMVPDPKDPTEDSNQLLNVVLHVKDWTVRPNGGIIL